jgi:superfamily II DNA or RNA helicase
MQIGRSMLDTRQLESAIWSIADGRATDEDLALFHADERSSLRVLDRLITDAQEDLAAVSKLAGEEREQVRADFQGTLDSLFATEAILRPPPPAPVGSGGAEARDEAEPPAPVQLQGSWTGGQVVVWAAGRGNAPDDADGVLARLAAAGGPSAGWEPHRGLTLPGGQRAEALAFDMSDVLGWLVAVGGESARQDVSAPAAASDGSGTDPLDRTDLAGAGADADLDDADADAADADAGGGEVAGETPAVDPLGPGLRWLGRVAIEGVRLAARGAMVPGVHVRRRSEARHIDATVRWEPALLDATVVDALAAAMPRTVLAPAGNPGDANGQNGQHGQHGQNGGARLAPARATVTAVIGAVVDAIVRESIERMEFPAAPPSANTPTDLDDTVIARMDGSPFKAPARLVSDLAKKLDQWARPVTGAGRATLLIELSAPDEAGVWLVSVFARGDGGALVAIDDALRRDLGRGAVAGEWLRLGRLFPTVGRAAASRRGSVALSQPEAWTFMTSVGPVLAAVGFEVRVPALSRRRPKPALRLFAERTAGSVVGVNQLSAVAWTVLFDDVELTAADVARLAKQARPLVRSRGKWIELDRVDLDAAAAALAERESITQMTGAEILRHSMGLGGGGLAGGVVVHGDSWANDIVRKAGAATLDLESKPEGFLGELRTYQAEALAWLGFLDAAELGGCLALDMGLGKTPTVLAHLARSAGNGSVLVIAPAAVVGNWAAEAARFAPGLRVIVHHGASRAEADALQREIAGADVVITTYATAVRDVDALAAVSWARVVLDEAQAIKNPANETSQQLRRIPSRSRIALTGTPVENGLGDLWAILDYTNPGLVGTRPAFLQQMAGDGEVALRTLNGILLFRRTKAEPEVARELPDKIDELDHCTMTPEQIGLYQAVLDQLVRNVADASLEGETKKGAVLAAITALKQICNHPVAYRDDGQPLAGRSGKLARLEQIIESVFAAGEKILVFTHFASWGRRLAEHLTEVTGRPVACYDGSLARTVRDTMVSDFQAAEGPGVMVLSLKAGGTGLNLTAANHVVLYDRWWNPAVEDQARDRAWRIGQGRTVISHRLVCPGTIDERVEEVVEGKRHIADVVLPRSSSLADLNTDQLRRALGLRTDELLTGDELLDGNGPQTGDEPSAGEDEL